MKFERMSGKHKVVYESMWGCADFSGENIEPNAIRGTTTYKIAGNSKNACKIIEEYYNISNRELFEQKYKKVVSGNGDEEKKILSLHSSSRCALLCFYNVEEKPITLNIDGVDIEFNYSTFEFKNPVIGYPSNMDVVLLSTDRNTVLFLESKFAEYYLSASEFSQYISKNYLKNKYSKEVYKSITEYVGFSKTGEDNPEQKKFRLQSKEVNYGDGIKQMISHYIGIKRRLNGDSLKADKEKENVDIVSEVLGTLKKADSKVYLGEILFDGFECPEGSSEPDPQEILTNYSGSYEKLAKLLNRNINDNLKEENKNKFAVLKQELKYTDVMKNNAKQIDVGVLEFYGIKE